MRANFDGFQWISVGIKQKYVIVYIKGKFEGDEELLQSKFNAESDIGHWRDGYSFHIDKESQFDDLVKWLKL